MIAEYAESLASRLSFDPALARRVRAEVEDHLREAADARGSDYEAIARFGNPVRIAAQIASAALARQARQVRLGLFVVLACLGLAMQMRVAWYDFTEWGVCEAQLPLREIVGVLDRSTFWLALAVGIAAWLCARNGAPLRFFRLLGVISATAVVAAVACDALLTALRFLGWDFSVDFAVPIATMALECACAAALLFQLYILDRRLTLAGAVFPEIR